jgi:DMSO/TMAO reductase YedYZ molybdopterin-dependent catalytic subunit
MLMKSIKLGGLLGVLITTPILAIMGAASIWPGFTFVPFALFNWFTRILPGPIITFGIDMMIETLRLLGIDVADAAKTAEQVSAIAIFMALGIVLGVIFTVILNSLRSKPNLLSGLFIGVIVAVLMTLIVFFHGQPSVPAIVDLLWSFIIFVIWGMILSLSYRRLRTHDEEATDQVLEDQALERIGRRQFLITLGVGSASITVIGAGLAGVLSRQERSKAQVSEPDTDRVDQIPSLPNVDDPVKPAHGTRLEYTPVEDHYKVFIQLQPTVIAESSWTLPIQGLVDNPLTLTLDDLRNNYSSRDQYVTLSCISGRIPTTLISTTLWTGVSLQEILAEAKVRPEARYLHISSGDGFHETIDLELIESDERIMLCYAWDGKPLPEDNGFPLRIWIPDRFGMKQPKWITGIEVSDEYVPGYWVERGWDEIARVRTRSVIDTVAVDEIYEQDGKTLVPIGGIAFSGARGISRVEVSVDGGSWRQAQLRSPLSETTWVIWRYDWPFESGSHAFQVRCYEGDGVPQIDEVQSARPSGATGIHRRSELLPPRDTYDGGGKPQILSS